MFPSAHTACSLIWAWGDANREMNAGIAPPSTTALVCSDVPEAMLVSAQADSNWMGLQSVLPKKDTNFGIKPARSMLSMGGCFSLESSFLRGKQKEKQKLKLINKRSLCENQFKMEFKSLELSTHFFFFFWDRVSICSKWSCSQTFGPPVSASWVLGKSVCHHTQLSTQPLM
jgi:hypothetical protein